MKKKLITIIILLSISLGAYVYFNQPKNSFSEEDSPLIKIKKDLTIEYGKIVYLKDYLEVNNGILLDKEINYESLGPLIINYQIKDNHNKLVNKKLELTVIDTTAPTIIVNSILKIEQGSQKKLTDIIMCGDNYDKSPQRSIEGTYDLNTPGEYPLTYIAKDSNGNTNKLAFTLQVITKSKNNTNTKTLFEEVKNKYQTSHTKIGIDVSKWQGVIDFKKVKEAGAEFVMIRLGTQAGFSKDNILDPKFKENINNALANNLEVGIYFHSYATTKEEALNQAKFVIDNLKDYKITLPISFDWESWSSYNTLNLSLTDLTRIQEIFLDEINKSGYKSARYGSKNYLTNAWQDTKYYTWVAHYTNKQTDYQGEYFMWQLCSDGIIKGINGYVDIDIYYNNIK